MLIEFNEFKVFLDFLNDQGIFQNNKLIGKEKLIYYCNEQNRTDNSVDITKLPYRKTDKDLTVKVICYSRLGQYFYWKTLNSKDLEFNTIKKFLEVTDAKEYRIEKSLKNRSIKIGPVNR